MTEQQKLSPIPRGLFPVAGTSNLTHIIDKAFRAFAIWSVFSLTVGITTSVLLRHFLETEVHPWIHVTLMCIAGILVYVSTRGLKEEIENYHLGRAGEIMVAHLLEELRPYGYTPIHDVPCVSDQNTPFNIDHILIGPRGVFVVETKAWRKNVCGRNEIGYSNRKLLKNGQPCGRKEIEQAKRSAVWLGKILYKQTCKKYWVTPILTFPGWWVDEQITQEVRKQEHDMIVVNPQLIGKKLADTQSCTLDKSEIDALVSGLRCYLRNIYDQKKNGDT